MSKPKFQVGQVVRYKSDGSYVQVTDTPDHEGNVYIRGHWADSWANETELRRLTAREKGPK